MKNNSGKKWSRNETILAMELYCRTPFGRIHSRNPEIINLAKILGRSADSVALKMSNLAHYDPALRKRSISAMSHTSKLDEEIFNEFYKNGEDLLYQAIQIRDNIAGKDGLNDMIESMQYPDAEDIDSIILHVHEGSDKVVESKARIGQYYFRLEVLSAYNNRCCVTGINNKELLTASHIKPWRDSDGKTEKANPCNGLCLNPFHDKAFDRGFITINSKYEVVMSKYIKEMRMDQETREWFTSYEGKQIELPRRFLPDKNFIQYHNDMIYLG